MWFANTSENWLVRIGIQLEAFKILPFLQTLSKYNISKKEISVCFVLFSCKKSELSGAGLVCGTVSGAQAVVLLLFPKSPPGPSWSSSHYICIAESR